MPISHEHKAIFVHIPKTGGQSVSKMLGIKKGVDNYYNYDSGEERTHFTVHMMPKLDYYKFAFVRNPYTRIISEYQHRMKNINVFHEPTNYKTNFVHYCRMLSHRWDKIESVDHFRKSHVIPQHMFVNNSVETYRFEDFENECKRLCDRLGIVRKVPKTNASEYTCEHTEETIEITNRLYRKDFERFGYETMVKERI